MRIKVHYKITIFFVIIAALVLSGLFFYLNSYLQDYTYQRTKATIQRELALAASFLQQARIEDKLSFAIDEIAGTISRDLELRVTITGLDGTVFGDSELDGDNLKNVESHLYRPEVQDAIRSGFGESKRFSTTVKKNMLYSASLFNAGGARGIIRLSVPLAEVELLAICLRKMLVVSILFAFFLAVVVSFLASAHISSPIREISWEAKNIARGNFSNRIPIVSDDEIGDLAKAFNHMSEQIRSKIEEITSNKSRLEAVLLSMFEGVIVIDVKGEILLMNQALKELFSVSKNTSGIKPIEIIRNIEIQELADRALTPPQNVISKEISVFVPEEKIFMVHATPVIQEGKAEGAVLVFHDISDIRRLERIRTDFVANVSHELRTPVASIKGYAETLLDGALNDKKNAREFLEIIHADSDRLAKLINDLLDLSKIESGALTLSLEPLAIEPVVKHIISGISKQAGDKSIDVRIEIPRTIPRIMADEGRIAQVLLNLIDNAIKYTREKEVITISAREENSTVMIEVSDTGPGISEKDLPRIFERFYRIDKARSRELGGTGLGLSIVKHIVQAHNGGVSVRSVLGQGSTFSFSIPKA